VLSLVEHHVVEDNLDAHVQSKAFDEQCAAFAKSRSSDNSDSDSSDEISLWSNDDTSSSVSSVATLPYDVPKLEAYLYHAGLSGPSGHSPKLIYRTSTDKFIPPDGPEAYRRLMKLRTDIPENHKLGNDNLWKRVREEVCGLLDAQQSVLTFVV
jgi:hypothetical protein